MTAGRDRRGSPFRPRLDILPAAQRRLWDELGATPPKFALYGGTAVALHLGHRSSVDFDFFAFEPIDPGQVARSAPYLANAAVTQSAPNTLSCLVDRGGAVKVSFFGLPHMSPICPAATADDTGLRVASLVDLAATKVEVVQRRAESKDYLDIAAILASGRVDLPSALVAAGAVHGPMFNPEPSLKALCYFRDGDLARVPATDRDRLIAAVAAADLGGLPSVDDVKTRLCGAT